MHIKFPLQIKIEISGNENDVNDFYRNKLEHLLLKLAEDENNLEFNIKLKHFIGEQ